MKSKSTDREVMILLATTNPGKAEEIRVLLAELPVHIVDLGEMGIDPAFQEKGRTFLENARGKSLYFSSKFDGLTLAEDSGLEVECLDGAPGVYSARFSGSDATDEKNIRKLLELMRDVPMEKRQARFVCAMVLSFRGAIIEEVTEDVRGTITFAKKGEGGFGYDPVFYCPPLGKTFAELLPEEKNRVSHRGRALQKMGLFLQEYLKAGKKTRH